MVKANNRKTKALISFPIRAFMPDLEGIKTFQAEYSEGVMRWYNLRKS